MAYEKPPCTFNQIDKAGKHISDAEVRNDLRVDAARAIWNWRAAHSYPLNALHMTLRNRTLGTDATALTAQRLKRFESILRKLSRRGTMQMSQMQDIGGCRAVVSNLQRLDMLRFLYQTRPLRHELVKERDYIADPKDDGYRSVHLMYRFRGNATSVPWDKLRIEIQLRTKLQHAWATCVETVDAFTGEDLKFGSGSSDWRRFFQVVGSVHARIEKTALIPGTPKTEDALLDEVRYLEERLQVVARLRDFAMITQHITGQQPGRRQDWYLVRMMPEEGKVYVTGYPIADFANAKRLLAEAEQRFEGTKNQAALVRTDSLKELRKAYPNYFADTTHFTTILEKYLKR